MTEAPSNLGQVKDWTQIWSDRSPLAERAATRVLDEMLPILEAHLPRHGRILEGGCGPGDWVWFFRDRGYDVVGLDYCTSVLQDSLRQEGGLPLVAGDVLSLPFADDSFDAVLSFGVVEHFEQGPQKALDECRRVLKRGCPLLVSVPHMNLLRRVPFVERLKKSPMLRRLLGMRLEFWQHKFTTKQLEEFLAAAGFETLSTHPLYHEGGLAFDVPVLKNRARPWEGNRAGRGAAKALKRLSPWITNHMVIAVARKR